MGDREIPIHFFSQIKVGDTYHYGFPLKITEADFSDEAMNDCLSCVLRSEPPPVPEPDFVVTRISDNSFVLKFSEGVLNPCQKI